MRAAQGRAHDEEGVRLLHAQAHDPLSLGYGMGWGREGGGTGKGLLPKSILY